MVDLYVYYKLQAADAPALAPRVRALQARLADDTGVRPQLKRRPGAADGLQTWMEVYPAVDAEFTARLAAAADAAGIGALLAGPRRTEVFEDLPCA
jgi:hypothetical protein